MDKLYDKSLWRIYVPVSDNSRKDFTVEYHRKWDEKIRKITGGLTINKRARGVFNSPNTGKLFEEIMIPVDIFCETREQIDEIANITINHYKQEAVMYYLISDRVYVKYGGK